MTRIAEMRVRIESIKEIFESKELRRQVLEDLLTSGQAYVHLGFRATLDPCNIKAAENGYEQITPPVQLARAEILHLTLTGFGK